MRGGLSVQPRTGDDLFYRNRSKREAGLEKDVRRRTFKHGFEALQDCLVEPFVAVFGMRVKDGSAADRLRGRRAAQDIPVSSHNHDRLPQFKLNPAVFSRVKCLSAKQPE